jgi:succinoglycan biosynthesis protein ExoW
MGKVAVIIPFFQLHPGLLARAVDSVLAQRLSPGWRVDIIVVDDSSPIPAQDELAGRTFPETMSLQITIQQNGGPGAARNTGLDLVEDDVDAVALLDSDDAWTPEHLPNALAALGAGADLYFANHTRPNVYESYFDSMALGARQIGRPVLEEPRLYQLAENKLRLILKHYLAQTSTIVFRRAKHHALRFAAELRAAGEDQVFLIELAMASSKILFSEGLDVVCCGDGVNVYFSNLSWDQPGCLRRMADRLNSFHIIEAFVHTHAAHDTDARRFVEQKIASLQRMAALISARGLLKRIAGFAGETRAMARRDPRFWSWYPRRLVEVGVLMAAGRFTPADE